MTDTTSEAATEPAFDRYLLNVGADASSPIRVAQWGPGSIGKTILRGVIDAPGLELVGVLVYSERKAGVDAGRLARRPTTGILATRSIDDIIATKPDIVLHSPRIQMDYSQHDDDVCRLLEEGIDVISTAGQHYPAAHGAERLARFTDACKRGGSTLFGVGISPGVIGERLVMALMGMSIEVDSISIEEVIDASGMPDPDFVFNVMTMGADPATLDLNVGDHAELYRMLYSETIRYMTDQMGVTVDEIIADHRVVAATRDLDVRAGAIAAGTVAATEWRWHAIVDGHRFLTLAIIWTMDPQLPDYAGRETWTVRVAGRPEMEMKVNLVDPSDTGILTTAGQYATAATALRAIPIVSAAEPGVFVPPLFSSYLAPST